jgi:hypothetical protein
MKQKRYTDEQIAFALRQAESGTVVAENWSCPASVDGLRVWISRSRPWLLLRTR